MRWNLMVALLKGFECSFFTVLFITLANPKAEQYLVGWESFSNNKEQWRYHRKYMLHAHRVANKGGMPIFFM